MFLYQCELIIGEAPRFVQDVFRDTQLPNIVECSTDFNGLHIRVREAKSFGDGHCELANATNMFLCVAVFGIDGECKCFDGGFEERFKGIVSFHEFAL